MIRKLKVACIAFTSILFDRTHIYCDDKVRSVVATRNEFIDYRQELSEMVNDSIIQTNLIEEVKEILQ